MTAATRWVAETSGAVRAAFSPLFAQLQSGQVATHEVAEALRLAARRGAGGGG